MTLDEAIERYTSNAEYERTHGSLQGYLDFKQLAEWLKDYKRLKEQEPSGDVVSKADMIAFLEQGREYISRNRDQYKTARELDIADTIYVNMIQAIEQLPPIKPQEPKWIPVSERLPKAGEYVGDVERYYLVQNEYGDMLVARYTHGEYWEQIFQLKPIGDEIVAWMPLPKPYVPQESEDKCKNCEYYRNPDYTRCHKCKAESEG